MTEQYVEELIQKYTEGTASEDEVQKLMDWYRSAHIGEVQWPASDPEEKDKVYNRMLQRLNKEMLKLYRKSGVPDPHLVAFQDTLFSIFLESDPLPEGSVEPRY